MNKKELISQITKKRSYLCIGLDSDYNRIPEHLKTLDDPVFEFNKRIIESTCDLAVAYKPNTAFYEARGTEGWRSLEKTIAYLNKNHPEMFTIADAKRGDIGNTSKMYAEAFLMNLNFDAITVAPYMGNDSVLPFLSVKNKWVILLALTSNSGAFDFQFYTDSNGKKLFEKILETSLQWATSENMMYVVGATKAENMTEIRKIVPDHFLLVPGVGDQGGSLKAVSEYGMTGECGLLVNSSRGIIFADQSEKFAITARKKAQEIRAEMNILLQEKGM